MPCEGGPISSGDEECDRRSGSQGKAIDFDRSCRPASNRAANRGWTMADTLPTATRVSDPGMRALYQLENRWQAWLNVEAALAHAQAELGIIPAEAAKAIAANAKL